jgi:hypothetical protein
VKSQLGPLLRIAALFPALGIHRDQESRDHRERSAPKFSHRLLQSGFGVSAISFISLEAVLRTPHRTLTVREGMAVTTSLPLDLRRNRPGKSSLNIASLTDYQSKG